MSNAIVAVQNNSFLTSFGNTGVSEDAQALENQLGDVIRDLFRNETLGEPLRESFAALDAVTEEASTPNWDGYDASPVSELGYIKAKQFLELLPTSIPMPEIAVDPDGDISFEWYCGTNNLFSVSVSGTEELTYAGIFGINKVHGVEYFGDHIPRFILINLQRLCKT